MLAAQALHHVVDRLTLPCLRFEPRPHGGCEIDVALYALFGALGLCACTVAFATMSTHMTPVYVPVLRR